jgi:hypothetical protein
MRIFKNKVFSKWADKENLDDEALRTAVDEMENGLIDADLGGHVVKKRVALAGRGKSGGARTLIAYYAGDKAFFVYGFAKNARANIKPKELEGLKAYASILLNFSERELDKAVKSGALNEVNNEG